MKTYFCHVRLGGSASHMVPKHEATAAEIALLREIHGADAVVDIQPEKDIVRTDAAERERLAFAYPQLQADNGAISMRLFGHFSMPLPKEVPGFEEPTVAEAPKDEPIVRASRVGRPAKAEEASA